jgi:hypothetical protein
MVKLGAAAALLVSLLAAGCSGADAASPEGAPADDDSDSAEFGDALSKKTDAAIQREIEDAADGLVYANNHDYPNEGYPFETVKESLPANTRTITEAILRDKLAWQIDQHAFADKPIAHLNAMTEPFAKWRDHFRADECFTDLCREVDRLNATLEKNLRGIKVFYFGRDGRPGAVGGRYVNVVVVGRTPKNNLAGVWVIAASF